MEFTEYKIISRPDHIEFMCPYCLEDVEISVEELKDDSVWELNECTCPECGKNVEMGDFEYD